LVLIIGLSVQDTTLGTTVGNLGMEETRFPRPVFAGDTLRAETKILAVRESKSRPTQGIVTFEHRGFNQRDEEIAYCRRTGLMMRRPALDCAPFCLCLETASTNSQMHPASAPTR